MAEAPNIENYQIPTGVASLKLTGDAEFRLLGNCIGATKENQVEKKEHFRFYGGKKKKDRTDTVQVGATGTIKLDEINPDNMALWALGEPVENTDGTITIGNLSSDTKTGTLKIVQDNDRGPKITWVADVSFTPAAAFNFIQSGNDDYNVIELSFDIEEDDNGAFGSFTFPAGSSD